MAVIGNGNVEFLARLDASMAIDQLAAMRVAVLSDVLRRNAAMYRLHVEFLALQRQAREIGGA